MIDRRELLRSAVKAALKVRREAGYPPTLPCDIYQLIDDRQLELQFFDVPSLEGLYLEESARRRICVSSLRPPGRQRFTAAHELGHSLLQHGTKADTIKQLQDVAHDTDPDEQAAEMFAGALMMTNSAVRAGFLLRNLNLGTASPEQVYGVSTWLGVGYTTLTNHMFYSMNALSRLRHKELNRVEPKMIKSELVKQSTTSDVFQFDAPWGGVRAHAYVGDYFIGITRVTGDALEKVNGDVYAAQTPGETTATLRTGHSIRVSVSREKYVGFYDYRYLPEEN